LPFFALLLIALFAVSAWAANQKAVARFTEAAVGAAKINPLDPEFVRKRINLTDFYHPHFRANRGKHFRECELFGPAQIVLSGTGNLMHCSFAYCDVVVIAVGSAVHSVIAFEECDFSKCSFYNVTFLVDAGMAKTMKTQVQGK
jgi:hypothetical protein